MRWWDQLEFDFGPEWEKSFWRKNFPKVDNNNLSSIDNQCLGTILDDDDDSDDRDIITM